MTANERPLTDDNAAAIAARVEAAREEINRLIDGGSFKMSIPVQDTDSDVLLFGAIGSAYALLAERERLLAENARLREALKPFALTDDERYELGSFLDDEDVYMCPDDGNDSVKNGWRKQVTIGNLRHAWYVLRAAAPASQRDGE